MKPSAGDFSFGALVRCHKKIQVERIFCHPSVAIADSNEGALHLRWTLARPEFWPPRYGDG